MRGRCRVLFFILVIWHAAMIQICCASTVTRDPIGRITQVNNGDGTITQYTLDENGNRLSRVRLDNRRNIVVTVDPPNSGTVAGDGPTLLNNTASLSASPAGGFIFTGWHESGALVSTNSTLTFTVSTSRNLIASFAPYVPEIVIQDPSTTPATDLVDGVSSLSFGSQFLQTTTSKTLTIRNTGTAPLTGLNANVDGAASTDFSVSTLPTSIGAGGSATLTIKFAPTAVGMRTSAVHIASNDANENPFDIALSGTSTVYTESVTFTSGTQPPYAINVAITAGSYSASGKTLAVGLGFVPPPGTILTLVQNTGTAPVNGIFTQLPQGSTVNLTRNGVTYPFTINYFGGNGNDIELVWANTSLVGWGHNLWGQLGDGSTVNRLSPSAVSSGAAPAQATWIAAAVGEGHSLALTSDGRVFSWGNNDYWQLGDGTSTSRKSPVQVLSTGALSGKNAVNVAAGQYHSLALCTDGTVYAWGMGGLLGDGSYTDRIAPVAVDQTGALAGKKLIAISAGNMHSLALTSEGVVVAWGANDSGQLGNGSSNDAAAPVSVTGGALAGKTVVAISAGGEHSLALCSDGTVCAWGLNDNGQIGDGTKTKRTVPVAISALGAAMADICAGRAHSAALGANGNEATWGLNTSGQVGNAGPSEQLTPSGPYLNAAQWNRMIVAGAAHCLSLASFDGTQNKFGRVWSWGANNLGQLGTGSSTSSTQPVYLDHAHTLAERPVMSLARGSAANHALAIAGNPLLAPEIAIEQPVGTDIADGGSKDFGNVNVGAITSLTFTVKNKGTADLIGLGTTIDGQDAASFTLIASPAALVSPGSSTTLTVRFAPNNPGAKTATIHITSNDADENPFDIVLTGTGVCPTISVSNPAIAAGSMGAAFSQSFSQTGGTGPATFGLSTGSLPGGLTLASDGLISGTPTQSGTFPITVTVTDSYGCTATSSTFVLLIKSNNADLSSLSLSSVTLSPSFSSSVTSYTANVPYAATNITVIPTASQANTAITVNGNPVTSGSTSGYVSLNEGSNVITTVVTAQDGVTSRTYSIVIVRAFANPGEMDSIFDPNVTGTFVQATAIQPDGKILIGGLFSGIGGQTRNNIARLNPDGSVENAATFNSGTGATGTVSGIALQPDGKILIVGAFSGVNGQSRSRIARLNADGSLESTTTFNPGTGANSAINCVALQPDGKIIIGGTFTSVSGQTQNRIARLNADGSLESTTTFNPGSGPDGIVNSMAVQPDGKILIAGAFGNVNGQPRSRIARLNHDGSLESTTTFNPGTGTTGGTNIVYCAIPQADGKILLGGSFTTVNGLARGNIARLNEDGSVEDTSTFNPGSGANSAIYSLAEQADGKIVAVGSFTTVNSQSRSRIARLNTDGSVESTITFNPGSGANNAINSVAMQADGKLLIGGTFTTVSGITRNLIARMDNDSATQTLTVTDITQMQWLRGGSSPETQQVTFELSTNSGGTWFPLGSGVRVSGGWELNGLNLPRDGQIRARARTYGGNSDGSSGLLEAVASFNNLPIPEIVVEQPAGTGLLDGASKDFGAVAITSNASLTFTIKNSGSANLMGVGITVGGQDAASFAVTSSPAVTVAPGGSTAFTVRFAPSSIGLKTAALRITSNDPDENPFDLQLSGTGAYLMPTFDEDLTFDDDQVPAGWTLGYPVGPGRNASITNERFDVRQVDTYAALDKAKQVPPNAGKVIISYTGNVTGNYWGQNTQIQFLASDDLYSATFGKSGYGDETMRSIVGRDGAPSPSFQRFDALDIGTYRMVAVFEDSKITYTITKQGASTPLVNEVVSLPTLQIRNLQTLRLFSLTTSGDPSWIDDVSIRAIPMSPSESWRQQYFGSTQNAGDSADDAIPMHYGVANLMKFATGMDPTKSGRCPGSAARVGDSLIFTYTRNKAAVTDGVIYVVEWSDTLAANSWSSVGVSETSVDQGATDLITATLPTDTSVRRFVRLRVSKP